MDTIAILGAGAWGTALAIHLARSRPAAALRLWARDPAEAQALATARENTRYLPGATLPPAIEVGAALPEMLAHASLILVATPIGALLEVAAAARRSASAPLFWVGKGFVATADQAPGVALAHRVLAPTWPAPVGVISGPSFAAEVARGLPTAVTVAATDAQSAENVAARLRGEAFRAYVSDDLTGVEVGGAVKNVLAIAAGTSDGLGFGDNARAALITRGLAETGRLSAALGGKRETLMGLAGLGDLVLTCTGDLSRNRRVGLGLAQGRPLARILSELGHVAEGVTAARHVHVLCRALGVDMPICAAVFRVLYENLEPRRAVETLLARGHGPAGR
jgi:glycerol-3-phosphate dehydrogenase (NAD(P)+)